MKLRNFYRRLFIKQTTCIISVVCAILLNIVTIITGSLSTGLSTFDCFNFVMQIILILFLFYGYKKHNLLSMQAGCCGLLVSLVYYQANYVFDDLFSLGATYIMSLGFWGSFFLACELMVLILEVFFLFNHFENFILGKRDYLRIVVNETTISILLFFLVLLMFVIYKLMGISMKSMYFVAYDLSLVATYMLVACNELILTIDMGE